MDLGVRLNCWPVFTKAHILKLTGIVAAVFFPASLQKIVSQLRVWVPCKPQHNGSISPKFENRSRGTMRSSPGALPMETGQILSMPAICWISSETSYFLAAQNYQIASQEWDKAATAYTSAGASSEAKNARENSNTAIAAARRALTDGIYFHMKAKDQYKIADNLNKHMSALDKAARNLELLTNGGLMSPWLGKPVSQ